MTSSRRSLRVETPVLEPDDALVARLAASARQSVVPAGQARRRRLGDWRVALAAAGVVVVTTGAAYAAGVLGPLPHLNPLGRPPVEETEPVPVPSRSSEGNQVEPPVGRPSALPTEGTGGPTDRPTGPPSGHPTGQPTGQPAGQPSEPPGQPSGVPTGQPTGPPGQPSGLPTPGVPTGRPSGKPSADPPAEPPADPGRQDDRVWDARRAP